MGLLASLSWRIFALLFVLQHAIHHPRNLTSLLGKTVCVIFRSLYPLVLHIVVVHPATRHPPPRNLTSLLGKTVCEILQPLPPSYAKLTSPPDGLRFPAAEVLSDINIAFLGKGAA